MPDSKWKQNRDKPIVQITLSPEAIATADELALMRGLSRSSLIEFLLREEGLRMRLDVFALGNRERKKRGMEKGDKPTVHPLTLKER